MFDNDIYKYVLSNNGQKLIDKIYGSNNTHRYYDNIINRFTYNKKYTSIASGTVANERGVKGVYQAYGVMSYTTGNASVIREPRIVEDFNKNIDLSTANTVIYESDIKEECESFNSYINTKFVRYLIFIGFVGRTPAFGLPTWRFVPDPGPFDHIFTDEELYKKYNLIQEEIDIIKSVIKERK